MVDACTKKNIMDLDALIAIAKERLGWKPWASKIEGESKSSQIPHSVVALKAINFPGKRSENVTS